MGLSGPTGAGKTTAGLHLRSKGFGYARYSSIVEEVARASGKDPSRSTLRDIGREIHETRGQYWLGLKLLARLPKTGCMVADGLRYPEDHTFMVESFGTYFCHIAIDAPSETRKVRFSVSRPTEDFERATTHGSEDGVRDVIKLAHRVIVNDGSLEAFLARVELVVGEWLGSIHMSRESF